MLNASFQAIGIGRAYDPNSQYGWYWTTIFGDVSDGPGWLCGQPASLSLFQSSRCATVPATSTLRTGPEPSTTSLINVAAGYGDGQVTGNEVDAFIPVDVDGMFGWVATDWVERGVVNLEQTASPSQPERRLAIRPSSAA